MKGKKGIEITTSTLIIFILAVIALIAIAAFFMGGFGKIADTVKGIFMGATAGVSNELAIQNCQQYCDRAQDLSAEPSSIRLSSAYCKSSFNIDADNNGEADIFKTDNNQKVYWKYYCYQGSEDQKEGKRFLNVACPGVTCQ